MALPYNITAATKAKASEVQGNDSNLDVRLAAVETAIDNLAVDADTYANGVFPSGLTASQVGTTLVYSSGGLIVNHVYYYFTSSIQEFAGKAALTYYVECDATGVIGIFSTLSAARTNLNTVVWNGAGFTSVTEANRTVLATYQEIINAREGYASLDLRLDDLLKSVGDDTATGKIGFLDKIYFTQVDQNEYIDSLADGYMDYCASTAHRIRMATADTDVRLELIGTTNSGLVEWMEDEDYLRISDGILMNLTEEIFFRDTAINIASIDDGHLDLTADISIDLNANVVLGANSLTINAIEIVGVDGQVNKAAVESSSNWDSAYSAMHTVNQDLQLDSGVVAVDASNNITFTQNAVAPFTSLNSGALVNTLYLKEGKIGIGTDIPGGQLAIAKSNGQQIFFSHVTELTTILDAATTDTTIDIPANVIVYAIDVRVVTIIPTAATFTVIGATSTTIFNTSAVSVAAGSTNKGNLNCPYNNTAAQKIRITPDLTPATATGQVRITVHYLDVIPATS